MLRKGFYILLFISNAVYALDTYEKEQVIKRIKPIGQVRVEGAAEMKQQVAAVSSQPAEQKEQAAGKATYDQYCAVCHRAGVAGAPKFGDAADWKSRTDNKSLAELTASAVKGINAMPAKGTCMSCSDKDIQQAIEYMLPHDN